MQRPSLGSVRMSVIVLTVIFCCVVFAWWWLRSRPRSPPALPGALPIIGHAHQAYGDRKHLWKFIQKCQRYTMVKGDAIEFWIGAQIFYVLTDPEDCLKVANTCLDKPFFYDFTMDFLGQGLASIKASLWKSHRKLLNPAFSQQVLNTFVNEMNMQARRLASQLASKVGQGPFDVRNYFISLTISTVTQTSLGLNAQDQKTIDTDYAEGIGDLFSLYCDRFQKVWLHSNILFNWSTMKRKQDQLTNKLKSIINPIIQKRKSELKANKNLNMYDDSTPGKFKPLLDKMLQVAEEQGVFTDEIIREHLDTFVAGANDTTSSALTLILIVIGSYRDVQERIFNELQSVLGHEDVDITKQDLPKLVYFEAVIKESMRLYPIAPLIGRKLDRDVILKNYTLKAGSTCCFGVYGLQRHSMWGPDADQFRPERWLDPATLPDHPSLYGIFGIGKRNCIGKVYAIMMMKTALAHVLRRYRVTAGDINNVVCEFDVLLKPVEEHNIELTLRT